MTAAEKKLSPQERELHKKLNDPLWRLNNLYWFENKQGKKTKFRMNWVQHAFYAAMWWLNVILKSRQLGMSTFMAIYILDRCLFEKNLTAGVVDKTDNDAKKKLAKMKFAYDNLDCKEPCDGPDTSGLGAMIKNDVKLKSSNDHELEFRNSSKVYAGTSLRGGTHQILHISELGYIAANFPKRAEELRSGAINTVHEGGVIVIESTHEGGKFGLNYEMICMAQESPAEMSRLHWKFHFFAWWQDPDCTLRGREAALVKIDAKLVEYFSELHVKHGILLSPGQQAWYAATKKTQKEHMGKEFPSTPEEAVNAVIKGAIYGEEISRARAEGRIDDFNAEPGMPWYVSWDIGMSDFVDMWAIQPVGERFRVLNFYENNGYGADHYAAVFKEWETLYGPVTLNLLPHDAGNRQFAVAGGLTTLQALTQMGVRNCVQVPRTPDVWIGIRALRALMANMVFHKGNLTQEREKDGVKYPSAIGALESYRTHDDSTQAVIREMPVHDASSHAADGLRTFAEAHSAGMISPYGYGQPGGLQKGKVKVKMGRSAGRDDDDDYSSERLRAIRVKKG